MKLSQRILTLRKQHNLSQEQLANKMGVTRQTISRWESELSTPDYSNIEKLSEIFGMSVNEFLNIEDQKEVYQEMINQITDTQNQQYKKITNYFKYFGVIIIIGFGLVGYGMYKLWNKPAQVIVTPSYQETTEDHNVVNDCQLEIVEREGSYVKCNASVSLNEYSENTQVTLKVKYNDSVMEYFSDSTNGNYYSDMGYYTFTTIYVPYRQDFSYCVVVKDIDGNAKEYGEVWINAIDDHLFYDINISSYSPLTITLNTIDDSIQFQDQPKSIDCYIVNKNQEVVLSGNYSIKKENDDLICKTKLEMTEELLKEEEELTLYIRINNGINICYASSTYTTKTGLLNPTIEKLITEREFTKATQ